MTEGTSGRVLHLAHVVDWALALTDGFYDWSTRGLRLSQVGFIHTSGSHQVRGVAERFYADDPGRCPSWTDSWSSPTWPISECWIALRSNDVVSRDAT